MESIKVQKNYSKSAHEIFSYWENFGGIYKFNPNVKSSPITNGVETGVGAERVCHFYDGTKIKEVLQKCDPSKNYLKIEITDAGKMPLKEAYASILIKDLGKNRSKLTFEMNFTPKMGIIGVIMAKLMMKRMMRKMLAQMLDGLESHIETGKRVGEGGKLIDPLPA